MRHGNPRFKPWEEVPLHLQLNLIRNQQCLTAFDILQLSVADIRVDFFSIQFTNIETATGSSAKDESFLTQTSNPVKKLVAKDKFRSLIQFTNTALENPALMYLTIVLALWNYQKRFLQSFGVEIFSHHKCIAAMSFCDILFSLQYFVI